MDVGASLVAHPQTAVLVKPGDRALYHPALAAEARAVRIPFAGDPDLDSAATQLAAGASRVVGAIAVDLSRPSPRASAATFDRRHSVEQRDEAGDVVDVSGGCLGRQRIAAPAGDQVVLGARLSAVYWARAGALAPPKARTWEESTAARRQSISPAALSFARSAS